MTDHAVKEEIVANALEAAYCLYVEVDPQPVYENGLNEKGWKWENERMKFWNQDEAPLKELLEDNSPIAIGDTVSGRKVVGVEVEWMPRHKTTPDKPLSECDYRDLDEVWCWSYKLEEI